MYEYVYNTILFYLRLPTWIVTLPTWSVTLPTWIVTESINSSDSSWHCRTYQRSTSDHLLTDYLTVPVSARPLRRFMSYIKYTWITSSKFPVNIWSVFGQPVRTNNDIEGWHQRLNKKAKGQSLQLYVMTKLLSDEARFVALLFKLMISCDICTLR